MSDQTVENLDLGALMESGATMDDIQAAPDYVTPPDGDYTIQVKEVSIEKYKSKEEPEVEKQRIKILYSVVETKQLVSADEVPVANESLFSETFMATTQGLGYFKARAEKILNADLSGAQYAQIFDSMKGVIVDARLSTKLSEGKKGTKNEGKKFENLNIRIIPKAA